MMVLMNEFWCSMLWVGILGGVRCDSCNNSGSGDVGAWSEYDVSRAYGFGCLDTA